MSRRIEIAKIYEMVKRKRKGRSRNGKRRKLLDRARVQVRKPPTAYGTIISNNGGSLRNLRVKHREYLGSISSDANKNIREVYEINPGLEQTFPWLGPIASRFETYQFEDLSFNFTSSVGTSYEGVIGIFPDYDADDDNSQLSKLELYQFQDCVRGPIWANPKMRCSRQNLRKRKTYYTRHKDISTDKKSCDTCSLIVAGNTENASHEVGELWCEYTVTLHTPQCPDDDPLEVAGDSTNLFDATTPLSDTSTTSQYMDLEGVKKKVVEIVSGSAMNFKEAGRYLIRLAMDGTPTAINTTTISGAAKSVAKRMGLTSGSSAMWEDLIDVDETASNTNPGVYNNTGVSAGNATESNVTVFAVHPQVVESL